MIGIVGFLLVIAAIIDGQMDTIQFHWDKAPKWMKKRDRFWNPNLSWRRKWKIGSITEERFVGSSSFLVWLTDGWHLLKWFRNSFICMAAVIALPGNWVVILCYWFFARIVYAIAFELSFK